LIASSVNGSIVSSENQVSGDINRLLATENDLQLININNSTGEITGIYITSSTSGLNINFPNSSTRFNNITTGDEYFRVDEQGAILSTYSTSSSEKKQVVLDTNDRLSLTTNPITLSLNFNYGTYSYTYVAPYDLKNRFIYYINYDVCYFFI